MNREQLHKIALLRLSTGWPYLDKELASELARAMVDFHLEVKGMRPSIEGILLTDFLKQKRIHRADHKMFRKMLKELVERTEINVWKEGRRWIVGYDVVDDLWEYWAKRIERGE